MEIIDLEFLEKIKKVVHYYKGIIPEAMYYCFSDILDGNNMEEYQRTFSMSKEDLLKYARICMITTIYKELIELIEILKSEAELIGQNDLLEYQVMLAELQKGGETYLNGVDLSDNLETDSINNGNNINLLIYTSYIDESRERTVNAHSGREEQTQKSVANLIEQLKSANYYSLRKKGYIHQHVDTGNNKPCYIGGNALERLGRLTTKVNYIRIPINLKNREELKIHFNIDFDTLYYVICYGDFKNEGVDEKKYYSEVNVDLQKHMNELLYVISIFKNDFTPETRSIAMEMISEGFKITDELTNVDRNR